MKKVLLSVSLFVLSFVIAGAAEQKLEPIKLPAPQMDKGHPLMQALKSRQSLRNISPDKLPLQEMGNILWAARGINRPESGKLTAPTPSNMQELDVYVALPEGLYLYDAKEHILAPMLNEDLRPFAGKQKFVQTAPVVLIYTADFDKMTKASEENKIFYSATDTGFISQNVYLYCASEGLATVVIGMVDKPQLHEKMKLRPAQHVILTQPVGKPAK
ncbi:MAG: nitroreductase family protein [Kiritimatiellia bacterium]|nr:nitroreductase family protein [Kiritimatiellia bacterium]